MQLLRIVKEHSNGIVETDTVHLQRRSDALTFVNAVNANRKVPYQIIDYGWALIGAAEEILENPTEGYIGPMKDGKPAPKT